MLNNEILFFGKKDVFSAQNYIKLLEHFFSFKDERWKQLILDKEKSSHNYHLCVRINNLDSNFFFYTEGKLDVHEVKTEVWDRDDNHGTDFVLVLTLE